MSIKLIWIGPWADDSHPERPHPRDYIDQTWDERERGKVAVYLEGGFILGAPLDGDGSCSMCGKKYYRGFVRTDGTFIWRDGLSHYVDEHSVRLPQVFIDHVKAMGERIDGLDDDDWKWWNGDPYGTDPETV